MTLRKRFSSFMIGLAFVLSGFAALPVVMPSSTVYAATCSNGFFSFPAWYRGVIDDKTCQVKSPSSFNSGTGKNDGTGKFVTIIVLNVIEILMQLVGYLSITFIIWGGFQYMLARGESAKVVSAKKTITNALIGLVLSIVSVIVVRAIGGIIS